MNTSIISHRMFVAALTHGSQASEKPTPDRGEAARSAQNESLKPPPKALAALTSRPWVNWPFGGWEEHSAS